MMYSADEIKLFVHNNSHPSESKILMVTPSTSLAVLRRDASEKLGILRPQKIYLATGIELEKIDTLKNNDHIYISAGEQFYKQSELTNGSDTIRVSILGGGGVGII
jgi:hypothetical protein